MLVGVCIYIYIYEDYSETSRYFIWRQYVCLQGWELITHWHSIVFQESKILNGYLTFHFVFIYTVNWQLADKL